MGSIERPRRVARTRLALLAAAVAASSVLAIVPASSLPVTGLAPLLGAESTTYGDLAFPGDELAHLDGLDYWWGAADVVTTTGNHYTVAMAYTSFFGDVVVGHQLFAHQGPYQGRSILSEYGPAEWGHPDQLPGEFLASANTYVPGLVERLRLETRKTAAGFAVIDSFERTRLDTPSYRLTIDQDAAEVHPTGELVRLGVDLAIEMRDGPPLLAGGTGSWWYGIPQTFGYPSRSFQYMQAARRVVGSLEVGQPDGTVLTETVDPDRSGFVMVHEYDATPEDIPVGLLAAQSTQLHPRYVSYYQGGMPWELMFFDLGDGAQLMVTVMAFQFTEEGTLGELGITPDHPTYRVLATVRLPSGESVPLDDELWVEHLSYREIVGRVPTLFVSVTGHWVQAWELRLGHPGGTYEAGDGSTVEVPPFDLGITPMIGRDMPAMDPDGNALVQRVPLSARGTWNGCPVEGFGWSEMIINWHDRTEHDPWFTGGGLPTVPGSCGDPAPGGTPGNGRPLTPDLGAPRPFELGAEGCQAYEPGPPTCEYVATMYGAIGGIASAPGDWTVTISRPGRATPLVVTGFSGMTMYACGIIQPGDHVTAEARSGAGVMVGNPLLCI